MWLLQYNEYEASVCSFWDSNGVKDIKYDLNSQNIPGFNSVCLNVWVLRARVLPIYTTIYGVGSQP